VTALVALCVLLVVGIIIWRGTKPLV